MCQLQNPEIHRGAMIIHYSLKQREKSLEEAGKIVHGYYFSFFLRF